MDEIVNRIIKAIHNKETTFTYKIEKGKRENILSLLIVSGRNCCSIIPAVRNIQWNDDGVATIILNPELQDVDTAELDIIGK